MNRTNTFMKTLRRTISRNKFESSYRLRRHKNRISRVTRLITRATLFLGHLKVTSSNTITNTTPIKNRLLHPLMKNVRNPNPTRNMIIMEIKTTGILRLQLRRLQHF